MSSDGTIDHGIHDTAILAINFFKFHGDDLSKFLPEKTKHPIRGRGNKREFINISNNITEKNIKSIEMNDFIKTMLITWFCKAIPEDFYYISTPYARQEIYLSPEAYTLWSKMVDFNFSTNVDYKIFVDFSVL